MRKTRLLAVLCITFLLVFAYGCNKGAKDTETTEAGTNEHGEAGEHTHEGETSEHTHEGETEPHTHEGETAEEGEESGPQIGLDGIHDEVRKGVRLIMSFDTQSSSFKGTVENTTNNTLTNVRVEVHLSNGTELGPTTPTDLNPGEKRDVELSAVGQSFNWWTVHAEVGASEH
jgi:hypothetical protein